MKREVTDNQRRVLQAIESLWQEKEAVTGAAIRDRAGIAYQGTVFHILTALVAKGLVTRTAFPVLTAEGEAALKQTKEVKA